MIFVVSALSQKNTISGMLCAALFVISPQILDCFFHEQNWSFFGVWDFHVNFFSWYVINFYRSFKVIIIKYVNCYVSRRSYKKDEEVFSADFERTCSHKQLNLIFQRDGVLIESSIGRKLSLAIGEKFVIGRKGFDGAISMCFWKLILVITQSTIFVSIWKPESLAFSFNKILSKWEKSSILMGSLVETRCQF